MTPPSALVSAQDRRLPAANLAIAWVMISSLGA
jgi:hypothetical protein